MKKLVLIALIIASLGFATVWGETIASAKHAPIGYVITTTTGATLSIPNDPANRYYIELQQWVAGGGVIAEADTPPAATVKAEMRERMFVLHGKILALEREKTKVAGNQTRVNLIQAKINSIDADIDAMRESAY